MNRLRLFAGIALLALAPAAIRAEPSVPSSAGDFTLVAVGDLIISRPLSMLAKPGAFPDAPRFAALLDLLGRSDVTYGNMETSIFDIRRFDGHPYSWDGDWMLSAAPAVAADLRAMKFDIVSRANNHALDWGPEGMRRTIAHLDAAGLVSAGTGENAAEATDPAYFASSKGVVGIVSMVSTFRPTTNALPTGSPSAPYGRPGVNGLSVTQTAIVDADASATLARIACTFAAPKTCPSTTTSIDLFGTTVRQAAVGETPFTYSHAVDPADLARNLAAVAAAKARARHVLATIHAHEPLTDEEPPISWQDPSGFLRPVAHAMIDAGADAFIVSGIHHVAGVEIYRGKPIFYGLGNFFWSDMQEPLSADLHQSIVNRDFLEASFEHPESATDADLTNVLNANSTFATAGPAALNRTFQTVLTRTIYDDRTGTVREIRLYPVDLGYGQKLIRSGIPRLADEPIATMILDRMAALSADGSLTFACIKENGRTIGLLTPTGR